MGNIQQLDEFLANKIAAGEVVERPASVVKELMENAIDAHSTIIEIELIEAGLSSIRIKDNGEGILEEDLLRAFSRHATSKIKNEHDLFRIKTLGFRGEALPSIASVAKVEIVSSTGDQGAKAVIHGGKLLKQEAASARKGTDIKVEELFFNTPARLKYMKTINTELGNITDIVNRLALSHSEISIRLIHNGRTLLHTNGQGDVRQVLSAIYGIQTVKKMIQFQGDSLDFTVSGWAALPEVTRASKSYISVLVNGRYIKNYGITKAVLEGYQTLLPIGRFPVILLSVEMDPLLVDVNVHPSKQEVRFSKEKELQHVIAETLKKAFREEILIPSGVTEKKEPKKYSEQTTFNWGTAKEQELTPKETEFESPVPEEQISQMFEEPDRQADRTYEQKEKNYEADLIKPQPPKKRIPDISVIGQAHGTYIIGQGEEGLYMIDQHAAQERIKYEYFREKLAQENKETQELLVPLTFDFSGDQYIKVKDNLSLLEDAGVFAEEFGSNSLIVRAHPVWFPEGEESEIIEEMIEQILSDKRVDIYKLREEAAILMSCKRSIKANHYLQKADMEHLVSQLSGCVDPFTCPHGRPVIIHFSSYDMEKMFKRVM
ncbi:DNA mismatch repair endonuclease MutL [Jeotgalibacillus salarius]|uniref:DNA mismatch repair protein MutL n=1 Tax=Jeotgalibacillus salarius TaxID=546023 RepID=A0A4Y8LII7_9BACL|nr:DNA mismatch repair endonuclease MutL [Jeotgalibacillus salarius]TFE02840.1 DNA mismatch repair endonuclease MutL [Jeotgalibacillus salarius]